MSKISNLIDKQVKEMTENTPDIFKENIGEPPEDKESKRIYNLFIKSRSIFSSIHPNNGNLTNFEYREFIDKIALEYVHQKNPNNSIESIKYICIDQLGNWYKVNELEIGLKDSQIKLEKYQDIHIPREWFKTIFGYYRFRYNIYSLIRNCKKLIKDYQDLIELLIKEENNESSK